MAEPTLDPVVRRLDRLELENRRMKFIGGPVLILFLALLVMGQTLSASPVVEAQRFLTKDPNTGKARAALSLLQDGSVGLSLLGLDSKALSRSAGLAIFDKGRKLRAELFAELDGSPALTLLQQGRQKSSGERRDVDSPGLWIRVRAWRG